MRQRTSGTPSHKIPIKIVSSTPKLNETLCDVYSFISLLTNKSIDVNHIMQTVVKNYNNHYLSSHNAVLRENIQSSDCPGKDRPF